MLAVILAVAEPPRVGGAEAALLVTARDIPPGSTLAPADVRVARFPAALVPKGALADPHRATGRVLHGPAAAGEPITETRLAAQGGGGPSAGRPGAVTVPIRLADPDVAGLLSPGARVDVVAADGPRADGSASASVLAADAVVVAVREVGVRPAEPDHLVLLDVEPRVAITVAASAPLRKLTVILR